MAKTRMQRRLIYIVNRSLTLNPKVELEVLIIFYDFIIVETRSSPLHLSFIQSHLLFGNTPHSFPRPCDMLVGMHPFKYIKPIFMSIYVTLSQ